MDALASAMPFATSKSPVAILQYGKITVKGNRMKMESNDTSGGIVKYMAIESCDVDGSFLVNIADMFKYVSKCKGDIVTLLVSDGVINVKHKMGKASFPSPEPTGYPMLKISSDEQITLNIPASTLATCVRLGKNFVSSNTLRPQMCAIYAYSGNGKFGFCATDTHILTHNEWDLQSSDGEEKGFFIMPNVFVPIAEACKNRDEATISFNDTHVIYHIGDTIIQSCMAKGKYPPFRRVIPNNHTMECSIEKNDLIDSVARVSLISEESRLLKINISELDIVVSCDNLRDSKQSSETLSHNGCNGSAVIGMNADNIVKALKVFKDGDILMRIEDSSHPVVFSQSGNENLITLVMPMNLNT